MGKDVLAKKQRIWELDFLRGFAIVMVFLDHAFYDFSKLFSSWQGSGVAFLEWLNELGTLYIGSEVRLLWRPAFLFLFFCVSGLCTAFSRNNFLRGIKVLTVAMLITVFTYFAEELIGVNAFILFGVLHCIGVIILIYSAVEFIVRGVVRLSYKIAKKEYNENISDYVLSAVCLALFIVFAIVNSIYNPPLNEVYEFYATVPDDTPITGMFFYTKKWRSGDYFPVFPYIAYFFFGAGLTKIIYPRKKSLLPFLDGKWHTVFSFAGRYSLICYVGGQVVAILFGVIASLICFGTLF